METPPVVAELNSISSSSSPSSLPSSVTTLHAPWVTIHVVGTAHVSKQSAREVQATIRAVHPSAVFVELCESRAHAIAACLSKYPVLLPEGRENETHHQVPTPEPEPRGRWPLLAWAPWWVGPLLVCLGGAYPWLWYGGWALVSYSYLLWPCWAQLHKPKQDGGLLPCSELLREVRSQLKQSSSLESVFRAVLGAYMQKVARDLQVDVGLEFAVALREARAAGATIYLGDRPVGVTVQRAWASLTSLQRLRLLLQLLGEMVAMTHTADMIERLKSPVLMEEMMTHLTETFPQLSRVLVEERDRWLGRELYLLCLTLKPPPPAPHDSQDITTTTPRVVVAVVGMGHARGLARWWSQYRRAGEGPNPGPTPHGKSDQEYFERSPCPPWPVQWMDTGLLVGLGVSWHVWVVGPPQGPLALLMVLATAFLARGAWLHLRLPRSSSTAQDKEELPSSPTSQTPPSLGQLYDSLLTWNHSYPTAILTVLVGVAVLPGALPASFWSALLTRSALALGFLGLCVARMFGADAGRHVWEGCPEQLKQALRKLRLRLRGEKRGTPKPPPSPGGNVRIGI